MEKHCIRQALIYAVIAMAGGVFYREFTKFRHFTGTTRLSVVHTHYFLLGMIFFLLLVLLEKSYRFSENKNASKAVLIYQIGLNITGIMLFVRGLIQILIPEISKALDASVSGISGIGHVLLGISLIYILILIKRRV